MIQSFNQDKPYDRFVREQLAGDEMDSVIQEARVAAGFHRLGTVRRNAGNQEVASSGNEVLTERTHIVGAAPEAESGKGRDHHDLGFTLWMAGGGVKGGRVVGATDDIGLHAIKDCCHFRDTHTTILHQLGLDQEELSYWHLGRKERLTQLHGQVIGQIVWEPGSSLGIPPARYGQSPQGSSGTLPAPPMFRGGRSWGAATAFHRNAPKIGGERSPRSTSSDAAFTVRVTSSRTRGLLSSPLQER